MKIIKNLLFFALVITFVNLNAQEKKIKFNKGTLKICSSKNFIIEGYDGDEVIIKSLHNKISAIDINGAKGYVYSANSVNNNKDKKSIVLSDSVLVRNQLAYENESRFLSISGIKNNIFFDLRK